MEGVTGICLSYDVCCSEAISKMKFCPTNNFGKLGKKKAQWGGGAVSTQKEKREYVHKIEKMGEKKAEFPCSKCQYFVYFPVGSDHFGCPNFPC